MFGAGGTTSSYREIEETDYILLWGSNARETHPIFFHHVLKAVNKGARLYVIDPRRTSSAEWADGWLGLDVGSDIALANAIGREIIAAGLELEPLTVAHAEDMFEVLTDLEITKTPELQQLEAGEAASFTIEVTPYVVGAIDRGDGSISFMLGGTNEAPFTVFPAGPIDCKTWYHIGALVIEHY